MVPVLCAISASAQAFDYERARWDSSHFQPAIAGASNEQCLACHRDILERRPLETSPAGVKASQVLAWYQTLDTYQGAQETMHRRHLVTPLARELMDLKCVTCHQGNNPREEAPIPPTSSSGMSGAAADEAWPPNRNFTLRKHVNTEETCLMCHGQFNYEVMALPGPWHEVGETFGSCMTCHAAIRTERHQVDFLKAQAIEEAGQATSDACYGCHGGRAWYRTSFAYPRHAWPGMPEETPEWAKDRPVRSDPRYSISGQ